MYFYKKNVLVAGGTGLIGIPLVELLLEQGARVRVVSLDDPTRSHPEAEFCRLNMLDPKNCAAACRGMDYVFNLLGVKGSPLIAATKPASFLVPTVGLALTLLDAARREEIGGYLFTSSIAVYPSAQVMREDMVWEGFPSRNDWYGGWGKRMGELHVEACRQEFGLKNLTIVRPANVYGSHDNFDAQNAMVVPSLIRRALLCSGELTVWGDGSPVRDFIHARDVARCMLIVAEKAPEKPVNIGSGSGTSIKDLVEIIANCIDPKPRVTWDTSKPSGDSIRVLDTKRAMDLGFTPSISLEQGVKEVMDAYRSRLASGDAGDKRYDIFL